MEFPSVDSFKPGQNSVENRGSPSNLSVEMKERESDKKLSSFGVAYNQKQGQPITVENLVKHQHYELIEVLLLWLEENFQDSKTPPSQEFVHLLNLIQKRTD